MRIVLPPLGMGEHVEAGRCFFEHVEQTLVTPVTVRVGNLAVPLPNIAAVGVDEADEGVVVAGEVIVDEAWVVE